MRKKQVWRYYCDYCQKANCSAPSISNHEKRCTMNPGRYCGMCNVMMNSQTDMAELIALLPDLKDYVKTDKLGEFYGEAAVEAVEGAMQKLRDAVDNCPTCIMAALRQRSIPIPMVKSFNFRQEMEEMWSEINAREGLADDTWGER